MLVLILTSDFTFAQQPQTEKDSTNFYKNIETYSKNNKFTKFIYHLVFRPVANISKKNEVKKKVYPKLIQTPYSAFEGKRIRYINIETLGPFGYLIADIIVVPHNNLSIVGNRFHVNSQIITIRNLLLIHQNQLFDSLLVKESERLVRSREYVSNLSFFVKPTSNNSDSVDIFIYELDKWSMFPDIAASNSFVTISLSDKNFAGLGHEFQDGFTWYHSTNDYSNNINYFIPNIHNTFVNATVHYGTDGFKNFTQSFAVDRPFFSPFARWAAGVNFTQQFRQDSIYTRDPLFVLQKYKFNSQDYWAGNAIQIFKGNTEHDRATNFISTLRFYRIRYLQRPIEIFDPQHMFSDQDFYLTSFGISTRTYVQDKYIFNYGIKEDVPIGKVYNLTGGYQLKNNISRLYLGARISIGYYYPWGYLSSNFEYGTFFRASHAEQGVLTAGINYFTGLFEIGKWKFRQFIKPQVIIGINRLFKDSLTLNQGYGLNGFNSLTLSGISRLLFTLQTQSYTPWSLIGFHFGPFINCSFGMLGEAKTGFKNSKIYSQIGLGVLIKNENLVLNTFQISIAFYPLIPGKGQDVFKTNSFSTTDFGFRDFEIGKPATVIYQ